MAGFSDWPLGDALEALEVMIKKEQYNNFLKLKEKYQTPENEPYFQSIESKFKELTNSIHLFSEVEC